MSLIRNNFQQYPLTKREVQVKTDKESRFCEAYCCNIKFNLSDTVHNLQQ